MILIRADNVSIEDIQLSDQVNGARGFASYLAPAAGENNLFALIFLFVYALRRECMLSTHRGSLRSGRVCCMHLLYSAENNTKSPLCQRAGFVLTSDGQTMATSRYGRFRRLTPGQPRQPGGTGTGGRTGYAGWRTTRYGVATVNGGLIAPANWRCVLPCVSTAVWCGCSPSTCPYSNQFNCDALDARLEGVRFDDAVGTVDGGLMDKYAYLW